MMRATIFETKLLSNLRPTQTGKITGLFILCCLADFLFYRETFGISLPIFFCCSGIISILTARKAVIQRKLFISGCVILASVIPAINEVNWLTTITAFLGTIWVSIYLRTVKRIDLEKSAHAILAVFIRLPFSFLFILPRLQKSLNLKKITGTSSRNWKRWVLPLSLTLMFLTLFSYANPIIGGWISNIEFGLILEFISFEKLFFWFLAATLSWPFIHPYLKKWRHKVEPKAPRKSKLAAWLNENNIALTLVMFNILFGLQTLLDFTYIWNGAELPQGVTYSEYVHQGTYILILTSLLAALFILYVTHEKRNYHTNAFVKMMLLIWTAQNVLLVLSTMSRMEIYITDYSLTELRIWASVWMLLVIVGLILIFLKLFMDKTNHWLIKGNLISLLVTMYVMSLTNLPYLIADYNLNIAKPRLVKIDTNYIAQLGPQTLPAIDAYLDKQSDTQKLEFRNQKLGTVRSRLLTQIKYKNTGWRQWSYRQHWLANYLKHKETNFE